MFTAAGKWVNDFVTSGVVDRMEIDAKATVAACLLIRWLSDVDWDHGGSAYPFGIGFLQSYKKRIPRLMQKRTWGIMARFKGRARRALVSLKRLLYCLIHSWLNHKSNRQGCRPTLVPSKPRRKASVQSYPSIRSASEASVGQHSPCPYLAPPGHYRERMHRY